MPEMETVLEGAIRLPERRRRRVVLPAPLAMEVLEEFWVERGGKRGLNLLLAAFGFLEGDAGGRRAGRWNHRGIRRKGL
jgi:hypothetical protein